MNEELSFLFVSIKIVSIFFKPLMNCKFKNRSSRLRVITSSSDDLVHMISIVTVIGLNIAIHQSSLSFMKPLLHNLNCFSSLHTMEIRVLINVLNTIPKTENKLHKLFLIRLETI